MINLVKGQRIEIGLTHVNVGLGWKPSPQGGVAFDLDASAFLLNAKGRTPKDEFFVFYGNQQSPDGAVSSSGDDRTGGNSEEGDDEILTIDLTRLDPAIEQIVISATIYEAAQRKQNFGQVHDSYMRICNADTGEEIAKYELEEDFSIETAVEFGRLYKKNGAWKFEATGNGVAGGLEEMVNKYCYSE